MSNWSNPTNTTNYVNVLTELKDRDSDVARGMDPKAGFYLNPSTTVNATPTNPILYSIRWNSELKKDQIYNGVSWVDKTDTYSISITGNAATATTAGKIAVASGWSVEPVGTLLYFKYNNLSRGVLDSSGNFTVIGTVTAGGTIA